MCTDMTFIPLSVDIHPLEIIKKESHFETSQDCQQVNETFRKRGFSVQDCLSIWEREQNMLYWKSVLGGIACKQRPTLLNRDTELADIFYSR